VAIPFSPKGAAAMTDNNIQGKVLFPLLKLHPFFPNLFLAFIFLHCKKINALQV
jgi:hypothetical protein